MFERIHCQQREQLKILVINYVNLNKLSYPDHYPLLSTDGILTKLSERKLFSKLDISSGYHYALLNKSSIDYTPFIIPQGQFAFKRLPFGLSSGFQTFQRAMNELFKKLEDILVIGKDPGSYYATMKEVLTRLDKT